MTLHLTMFVGGNALSPFRARQLLPQLQGIEPRVESVQARYVHWVATPSQPTAAEAERLCALLQYGEPFEGSAAGQAVVVSPRLGTVSPWASKATDIAHNCGLDVRRIERATEYRIGLRSGLLGGAKTLNDAQLAEAAALLHDRMTESWFTDLDAAALPNLAAPLALNAADPLSWPPEGAANGPPFEAVVCINMIHISPWAATEGLMSGAARMLRRPGGLLVLYGPYREADVPLAPSNAAFDESLKARDPDWGLRALEDVAGVARSAGLALTLRTAMPANNLCLLFRRV